MQAAPGIRVREGNRQALRPAGDFVLYWMTAARRLRWNFALQEATARAAELQRPLLILEHLPCGAPWDSDRLHCFALPGMAEHARALRRGPVGYYPCAEPVPGAGLELLRALADRACLVVADEFPCGLYPQLLEQAASRLPVALRVVDSCGLLPLRATGQVFATAYAFRRFLQRALPEHLRELPLPDPLRGARLPRFEGLPAGVAERWPPAGEDLLAARPGALAGLPLDHAVPPAPLAGGPAAARRTLRRFLDARLAGYAEDRNHPDLDATSGLSPYLHCGHISVAQVFAELAEREGWTPERLGSGAAGRREGWWGMSASAEAFLDELITWRELGYNFAAHRPDYAAYASLPDWAQATLAAHAADPRDYLYSAEQLAAADTHDPLWNAAQRQLVREGRLHNYLRMLWGKKILEWTPAPQAALEIMIELNNRWALDGRNPNSYTGIAWVLGRCDRPWGPERPIFGKIRYMSSENTLRKLRVSEYLRRYAP